ncbi:MAPEG family protein [Saccharospirillum salsuginis]|uniref:Glutathione metabolism protein n=1 Tax=Saccharospirillum salsuginis TaxID=418750 RepID=A0A918N8H6_9GAMM|nr:MAPEG family protein [Saccharospirillum salsuginis]GGX47088.1 hypothetical protein GCM10007392_12360 [Saccharospirillum salsuginis]
MNIYLLCTALLVLLYFTLSFNVSRVRGLNRKQNVDKDVLLSKAIRAHGNASEYIPLFVLAFLFYRESASWILLALTVVATAGRVSHALGMLTADHAQQKNPMRYMGALATYIGLLGFGLVFLIDAFTDFPMA